MPALFAPSRSSSSGGRAQLPTLDDALAFFVDEAPGVGLHVDLKLRSSLDELAAAIVRHGLEARTSSAACSPESARRRAGGAAVRIGITYPEDRLSISRKPYLWPIVSLGLRSMRASVPMRVPRLARLAGASAVMLQHRLVSAAAVERSAPPACRYGPGRSTSRPTSTACSPPVSTV